MFALRTVDCFENIIIFWPNNKTEPIYSYQHL